MRWAGIATALLLVLGAGFFLRASPGLEAEGLSQDAAYHLRRALAWDQGTYGERDVLRLHPEGRNNWETDPPGLYAVTSTFLGSNPESSIRVFQSLTGALIALAGFLVATRLWGTPYAGLLAAAFLAVVPGHVVRTFAPGFRYDGLGTLLLGIQLYTIVSYLQSQRFGWWLLTALVTLFALTVWRATVGYSGLEILVLAGVWILSGDKKVAGIAGAILLGLLLGIFLTFMRAQGVIWSQGFSLTLLLGVGLFALSLSRNVLGRLKRLTFMGLLVGLSFLARTFLPQTPFDREEGSALGVWLARFGFGEQDPFLETLYGYVRELGSPGLSVFWNPNVFSVGLTFVLVGLALVFLRQQNHKPFKTPSWIFVLALTSIWVVLTIMVDRNKVFAAIFLATLAGAWIPVCQSFRNKIYPAVLTLGVTAALAYMGWSSYQGSKEFVGQFDAATEEVCTWLKEAAAPGEGVASDWGTGYLLQTYAGVPTLTDGFLESTKNRTRIKTYSQALTSPSPSVLQQFCRDHQIRFLLLHRGNLGLPFVYAGVVPKEAIEGTVVKIPPEALNTALPQLSQGGVTLPGFELAYEKGPYRILRVDW